MRRRTRGWDAVLRRLAGPLTPDDVRTVAFALVRFQESYATDEVDEFLDLVQEDLRARLDARISYPPALAVRLTRERIDRERFDTVRFRRGYDVTEVDEFLELVAARLGQLDEELAALGVQVVPVG